MSIHLFSDQKNYKDISFENGLSPFTSTGDINSPHRRSKVDYLPLTPFDQTLYLDTDTQVNADIREMFRILEQFDIALNHAHRRSSLYPPPTWRLDLPQAFPQYNSGVVLFNNTRNVLDFIEEWKVRYHEAGFRQDQITLRELLWLSDLRIATLPPEYNVRYIKYHYLWSKSEAATKIFHLQRLNTGWFWGTATPWLRKLIRLLKRLGFNPSSEWLKR